METTHGVKLAANMTVWRRKLGQRTREEIDIMPQTFILL